MTAHEIVEAKKAVRSRNRFTAKQNAAFAAMTPKQKRIRIARDVLEQLASRRILATTSTWVAGFRRTSDSLPLTSRDMDRELSEILAEMTSCRACGIGSLFMCAVERADKISASKCFYQSTDEWGHPTGFGLRVSERDIFPYLAEFFHKTDLEMIESAFEKRAGRYGLAWGTEENISISPVEVLDQASNMYNHLESEMTMQRIMENIIRNQGRFNIKDKKDAVHFTEGT